MAERLQVTGAKFSPINAFVLGNPLLGCTYGMLKVSEKREAESE